jgi:thiol-disulfide isomerase/thioredoxin
MNMIKPATGPTRFRPRFHGVLLSALCAIAASILCFAQTAPRHLPDFQFKLLDGTVVKAPALKGRVVVLEFWGTWCKPCLAEIPDYNAFYKQYKTKDVFFLALAVDSGTEEKVREATKRLGIQYPVAAPRLEDLDIFGDLEAVPTTWIVDRSGKVQTIFTGSDPAKARALRQAVERLLKD